MKSTDETNGREARGCLAASLLLLAVPLAFVVLALLGGVLSERPLQPASTDDFVSQQNPGIPEADPYEPPLRNDRPDLEGHSLSALALMHPDAEMLVFDEAVHGLGLSVSRVEKSRVVSDAVEVVRPEEWAGLILLRVESNGAQSEPPTISPWFLPDHPSIVKEEGADPCFECHEPMQCAGCHVVRLKE